MAVLLKVGNTTDFTRPPENFPTCGDFYNAGASQTTPKDDLSSSNNTSINKAIISTENAVSGVFAHFWTFVKNSFAKNGSSSCCVRSSLYFTLIICYVLRYLWISAESFHVLIIFRFLLFVPSTFFYIVCFFFFLIKITPNICYLVDYFPCNLLGKYNVLEKQCLYVLEHYSLPHNRDRMVR